MDTPAKADVQGLTHHNGKCGCPFCLNPGENVSSGAKKKGHVHVYSAKTAYPLRTAPGTIAHARAAQKSQSVVRIIFLLLFFSSFFCKFDVLFSAFGAGVWSPLPLCYLPVSTLQFHLGGFRWTSCTRCISGCPRGSRAFGLIPSTANPPST
jgi:hypothetical protein